MHATTVNGKPRTKVSTRTGETTTIPQPKLFSEYCKFAGSIDFYNHYRTEGKGLEDTWKTHSPKVWQFSGLIGFVNSKIKKVTVLILKNIMIIFINLLSNHCVTFKNSVC